MRILFLQKWLTASGGSELQLSNLLDFFSRTSFKVFLWNFKLDTTFFLNIIKNNNINRVLNSGELKSSFFFYISLFSYIKKNNINVVYTREARRLPLYFLICKMTNVPLVYHVTTSLKKEPQTLIDLIKVSSNEFKVLKRITTWQFSSYINSKLFPYVDKVVLQTRDQEKIYSKVSNNYAIIPNGHKISNFKSQESKRIILWVGNFHNGSKRPELFLKLAENFIGKNYMFVMAGRNYSDIEKAKHFKNRISRLTNVIYLSEVPPSTVSLLYSKSFLYINTSSSEGLSNTFIQALINSVPILSLDIDYKSILQNKQAGFLCKDIKDMEDKLKLLISDADLYKSISKKAFLFSKVNFDIKKTGEKLCKIFAEVSHKDG